MPGPAVTVEIKGDTSSLDTALTTSTSGFDKFKAGISGFLSGIGGVAGAVDLAVAGFDKLIELGGPEAKAALDDISATFSEAMAPALAELQPYIVELVKALGELLTAILPLLVPLLNVLATTLGAVLSAITLLVTAVSVVVGWLETFLSKFQPLIDIIATLGSGIGTLITAGLDVLWIKLDAVRGMFDLIWKAISTVIGWIADLLGAITDTALKPLQDLASTVGGLIGDLGEVLGLTHEVAEAGAGLGGGIRSGGYFGPGAAPATQGITINTGASPAAVMRAYRRYTMANGGPRMLGPRGAVMRGW